MIVPPSPVWIHNIENGLELWLRLLHHGQVVAEGAQAGLEGVVVEATRLVLVEVAEHHAELLESVLRHSGLVSSLQKER